MHLRTSAFCFGKKQNRNSRQWETESATEKEGQVSRISCQNGQAAYNSTTPWQAACKSTINGKPPTNKQPMASRLQIGKTQWQNPQKRKYWTALSVNPSQYCDIDAIWFRLMVEICSEPSARRAREMKMPDSYHRWQSRRWNVFPARFLS